MSAAFLLASGYLLVVGIIMLARPGLVSMAAGAELLGSLALAGPYMFLLMGATGAGIALGLLQLNKWARWLAILAAVLGMVSLLPDVSSAVLDFRFKELIWGGLGTIVRVVIIRYLYQVKDAFAAKA